MKANELYPDIAEAVRQRSKEIGGFSEVANKNELYPDIAEAVRQRSKEIAIPSKTLTFSDTPETMQPAPKIKNIDETSRNFTSPETNAGLTVWQGVWLIILVLFLVTVFVVMTSLSLLSGNSAFLGAYWFLWGILVLLVVMYPVIQIVERLVNRC